MGKELVYSTTTRCLGETRNIKNFQRGLRVIETSKFQNANFYFSEIFGSRKTCFLDKDDYRQTFQKIIKGCDLVFNTSHAPIHFPFFFQDYNISKKKSVYEKRILRSIELSGMLHAKWIVIHVGTALDSTGRYDLKESVHKNICYLKEFVSCAMQNHIGIAIENGTNMEEEVTPSVDELIEITDYYNHVYQTEILGICFDFGHANVGNLDIYREIQKIGKRLKVTHLHDNFGSDTHNFPYDGTVDWENAAKALKDIDYDGDLTLEVTYKDNPFTEDTLNETYALLDKISHR